jgi:hypothetical protein
MISSRSQCTGHRWAAVIVAALVLLILTPTGSLKFWLVGSALAALIVGTWCAYVRAPQEKPGLPPLVALQKLTPQEVRRVLSLFVLRQSD